MTTKQTSPTAQPDNGHRRRSLFYGNPLISRKLRGDLKLNRGSFFMVWLIFTLGLTFYSGTYPAGKNFDDSVQRVYDKTHLADLWFEASSVPADTVDSVRKVNGVSAANGRIVVDMGMDREGSAALVTLRAISLPESDQALNNIVVVQGRLPATSDEIALMEGFALVQGIQVGSTVRLNGAPDNVKGAAAAPLSVRVVGLVSGSEYLLESKGPLQPFPSLSTFGVGYLPYDALAARFDLVGKFNNVVLTLAPSTASDTELSTVREAVSAILRPYDLQQVLDRHQFAAYATLNANVGSNTQVALVFAFVFLLGSGSVMLVLLARQIESERRAIGTLRAMGYSRGEIVSYYLMFALITAVTGAIMAIPAGYAISAFMLDFFQRGMIRASVPFSSNPLNWGFILLGIGISAMMALLGALIPAWRAATTDPGIALRPPAPGALPLLARLPIPGPRAIRQSVRDLLRIPGRSVGTIIGTVCGLMLTVLCFATWDAIDYNFNHYYRSHSYDFTVTLKGISSPQELENRVKAIPGVSGIELGLIAPTQVKLADRSYTALGVVLNDQQQFITFEAVAGAPAFSNNKGVWLGHNLSRTLNAHPGDLLTISAQGITKQVRVEGVVKQVLGAPMYIPASLFKQWVPLSVANQAYVRVNPAHRAEVQRALNGLPNIIGVEDWSLASQDIQRVVDFNGNNAAIFLMFGLVLTFVVLFNSINSNLQERRTELSIMRMQGVSNREIGIRVGWEVAITLALGLLIGIAPTLHLVNYVMQSYNTDVAGNLTMIYPLSWLISISIIVLTALFSLWLPLRHLRKINLGDISKAVGI